MGCVSADLRSVSDTANQLIITTETRGLRTERRLGCDDSSGLDKKNKKTHEKCLVQAFQTDDRKDSLVTFFVCMYQSGAHPVSSDETTAEKESVIGLY